MDEIEYTITAKVNDEIVFQSSYPQMVMLEEELYKAERAVQAASEENLIGEDDDAE